VRLPAHRPINRLADVDVDITVLPVKTITFKVSDDEARMIRSMAKAERTSVSEYLRRKIIGTPPSTGALRRVRCKFTGAMIFDSSPGITQLTTQGVREMPADFPGLNSITLPTDCDESIRR
jgi:hypothetical protein